VNKQETVLKPAILVMTKTTFTLLAACLLSFALSAQFVTLPDNTNHKSMIGQRLGVTDIEIHWVAPGVKGREGKIWGTPVAHYGFQDLGFGTSKAAPWRAGANENTTFSFSTDVTIQGKPLAAGKYGFAIALSPDSCTLIFSKNANAWGTFFYKPEEDALRVTVRQQKDLAQSREWLAYGFSEPTSNSITVALEWERWRIPFTIGVDEKKTTLASIRSQMSGTMGFDPPSLQTAAQWCLTNADNYEEALRWISDATDPRLGGLQSFSALSTKGKLLEKLGRKAESEKALQAAFDNATALELHGYGRQLIGEKKHKEALEIFQKNHQKQKGVWPTEVGLARGYSANGNVAKALEHAKVALTQAPDDLNKRSLEAMIKTLSEGKTLQQ
jgi:tetratricopeptide (TPR) repeat protein